MKIKITNLFIYANVIIIIIFDIILNDYSITLIMYKIFCPSKVVETSVGSKTSNDKKKCKKSNLLWMFDVKLFHKLCT